jgi:hypothetical protein
MMVSSTPASRRRLLARGQSNTGATAARAAKLPDDLILAAYRRAGITELSDAELTEQGVMAMTGIRRLTPSASISSAPRSSAPLVRGVGVHLWSWRNVPRTRVGMEPLRQSRNEA